MFRQISLGQLGLLIGGVLTVVGFAAYFTSNATLNLVGFFYGIPLLLGGLALKAAELPPAPFLAETDPAVLALRSQQATDTQNQVRKDVTRYRYGQRVHLEPALERLGLGPTREDWPVLRGIQETAIGDAYGLVLEFTSAKVPLTTWQEKQEKIERFFGPGVRVELTPCEGDRIRLALIATAPVKGNSSLTNRAALENSEGISEGGSTKH